MALIRMTSPLGDSPLDIEGSSLDACKDRVLAEYESILDDYEPDDVAPDDAMLCKATLAKINNVGDKAQFIDDSGYWTRFERIA